MQNLHVNALTADLVTSHDDGSSITMKWGGETRAFVVKDPIDDMTEDNYYNFTLLDKELSYDVDISTVGCSCNAALFFVSLPGYNSDGSVAHGSYNPYYCDANDVGGVWCWEHDTLESNKYTMTTTPHKCSSAAGGYISSCDKGGCGTNAYNVDKNGMCPDSHCKIDTRRPFRINQRYEVDKDSQKLNRISNKLVQGNSTFEWTACNDAGYLEEMTNAMQGNMKMVFQLWGTTNSGMSWLDGATGCSGDCNKDTATVTFSNIEINSLDKPPSPPSPAPTPSPPAPPPTPFPPACTTPVDCHGALRKSGNRITDKHGNNVKLNGLSMFWSNWAGSFWNGDVVKYLASQWKISLVRCAMAVSNDDGNVPGGYMDDPDGNKAKVSAVVDAAIEAGIYVIIDWHVEGRCNADQSKPFFLEMAQKYGQHPNIIWETCNEPHGWAWGSGLKSYHDQVIPTIREHSSNLIVAGTNTWSQDVDEASRDQLSDSNVAYTLHFYSSMHKQANRDKASTAMSNGAAVFVTEWGVEQHGEGNAETEIWLDFLRQHGISNSMWGIYDKDSEAWAIVHQGASARGGWSQSDLTNTGNFAKAYLVHEAGGGPSDDCGDYCAGTGCGWTEDFSCPWAPAPGAKGRASDDGSMGYKCCCAKRTEDSQPCGGPPSPTFTSIIV